MAVEVEGRVSKTGNEKNEKTRETKRTDRLKPALKMLAALGAAVTAKQFLVDHLTKLEPGNAANQTA